jgi:iron-sulfur cluster assembly protein
MILMSVETETRPSASSAPSGAAMTAVTSAATPAPAGDRNIVVAPSAIEAIKAQIQKRGVPDTALRVGLRGGGCSGFSYVIEFHDGPPRARDRVYDLTAKDGTPVRVVVDSKSLIYLNGATLEWEDRVIRRGFKWVNPQEKAGCGCGHSFSV